MSGVGATPLVIDTGAFYARMDDRDQNHEQSRAVFDAIESGDPAYRPLYTTGHVLAELVTLGLLRTERSVVADSLGRIRSSPRVTVLHPDASTFTTACHEFQRYDDLDISLVDQVTGVLANEHDVTHVFTFDPDDFRTLGFTVVPGDTGDA